jgi:hypothetical protein
MLFVRLNMIDQRHTEEGEDDFLQTTETTKPVVIAVDQIRNFYPRKGDLVGSRIMFRNGAACPVKETIDEVDAAIRQTLS